MIVHEPEIIKHEGSTIVFTKLETLARTNHIPPYLWLRVSEQWAPYLTTHSDAYLFPALLGAMHYQEPLEMRGTISPRLAYILPEYMHILSLMVPELHEVDLIFNFYEIYTFYDGVQDREGWRYASIDPDIADVHEHRLSLDIYKTKEQTSADTITKIVFGLGTSDCAVFMDEDNQAAWEQHAISIEDPCN